MKLAALALLGWLGASASTTLNEGLLPSRSSRVGRLPGQGGHKFTREAPTTEDEVYDGICDHFIGFGDYNTVRCANRCRAVFARKNGLPTAAEKEREKLGISAAEYVKMLRDSEPDHHTYHTRMNMSNLAFDKLIAELSPNCIYQSYRLDDRRNVILTDNCFTRLVLVDPSKLGSHAKKLKGVEMTNARSPAHCQYLCQESAECFAFSYNAADETTCLLLPRSIAEKFGRYAAGQLSESHPCSLKTNPDPTTSNGCQLCDGRRTIAYESPNWVTGTKYCVKEVQTMCEVTALAPLTSPFGDWKKRMTEEVEHVRRSKAKKIRWRYKGEDEWHTGLKYEDE